MNELLKNNIDKIAAKGSITPEEQQLIFAQSDELGEDKEIVLLYMNAALQKMEMNAESMMRKMEIICPHCGAKLKSYMEKCPECGNLITARSDERFEELLKKMHDLLVELKSGSLATYKGNKDRIDSILSEAKEEYGHNDKILSLIEDIQHEVAHAKKEIKQEIIRKYSFIGVGVILAIALAVSLVIFFGKEVSESNMRESARQEAAIEREAKREYEKSLKPEIDKQYKTLVGKLNALPEPTLENFRECLVSLRNIEWPYMDPQDESDNDYANEKEEQFREKVKEYAYKLYILMEFLPDGEELSESERSSVEALYNYGFDV